MNELNLESNPRSITNNELFDACIGYNRVILELEEVNLKVKDIKSKKKQLGKVLHQFEGKNTIVTRTDSQDKVELFWEAKEIKGNPEPKPTQDKIKFIPNIRTVDK